jgi:hypothetical protein
MRDEVIFGAAAKDYTALGLRVVPTGGEDGKRPLIRRWQSVGLRAVDELADRYPCANIGLIDGDRGGITRVDVDDPALEDTAIERFGDTPVVVGTPSGGAHFYYRANGERRVICLDGEKIDILGWRGLGIAPPSIHPTKGPYCFRKGGLNDFEHLPAIRTGSLPSDAYLPSKSRESLTDNSANCSISNDEKIPRGRRGKWLFQCALRLVRRCNSLDELIDALRDENQTCDPPVPPSRVITTARSAWQYEERGDNWVGQEHRALIFVSEFDRLIEKPDAIALLLKLRLAHASRKEDFFLANALAKNFGWGLSRFRNAKAALVDAGFLICIHEGGEGPHDPPSFKFG